MNRTDLVTITSHEYERDGNVYWLTLKTDKTGERKFRGFGVYASDYQQGRRAALADKFLVGATIELGELRTVPSVRWDRLGCIEQGLNIHIGEIVDGLEGLCPRLVFWRMIRNGARTEIPTQYEDIARKAAMAGYRQSESILKESGFFSDVYEFRVPPPSLKECIEV